MAKKDKRVKVTIDLECSTLWYLFNEAHKRDITLNQMVEIILKQYIAQMEKSKRLDGRS
jgi:hypothetical protein